MKHLIVLALFFSLCSTEKKNSDDLTLDLKISVVEKAQNHSASKILFARKKANDNGWSIYMVDPNGTNEEVLIPFKSGQGEYNPDISPDGKTIVFNTYRYGGWKLSRFDVSNGSVKRISPTSNYYMNGVFSPDGTRIAFERNVNRTVHIFVADSNGENEKNLTQAMGNQNRMPTWTADGENILFYSENGKSNDIHRIHLKSRKIKNITNNSTGNDFNPSVSPDGKKVAFFSDRDGFLSLYTMDISGQNQTNLSSSIQNEHNSYNYYKDTNMYWIFKTSWSPDGKSLVFSNATGNNIDLFTVNENGTELKQITTTSKSEFTPVWGIIKK